MLFCMPPFLLLAMTLAAASPSHAGTIVFTCYKDGQKVLTDRPCDSAPVDKSSSGTPAASNSELTVASSPQSTSPVGQWRGQVQFQANESGQVVQAAHSVVLLTAEFTPDGKLAGASAENGCKLLGIWSQDPQHIVWLDLTLSACRFPALDRRFGGSFLLGKSASSGQLQVLATEMPHLGQSARMYDIRGTLRR
jgi:hypothetical protein